jgi:dipeptidyl aminopeptidase/acylaminoacyl peptidase
LHGTNDQTVHYDESVQFAAKLQKAGVNVTLVPVSNANHYFSQKSRPTINEIEKQVVGFLGRYLLGGQ